MHDAIFMSMTRIRSEIPYEILDLAFGSKARENHFVAASIESNINNEVIQRIVRPDCNLNGGKSQQITLRSEWREQTRDNSYAINAGVGIIGLYRIPPEARSNSIITEVFHVQHPMPYGHPGLTGLAGDGATICGNNKEMYNSHTESGIRPTPNAEVLNGDIIRLHPGYMSHIDWVLSCRVAYDENLTNLNSSAVDIFSQLAVLATKRAIYQKLIISIDRAYIEGGAEIAVIKDIISQWSDLTPEYTELLKRFYGTNAMDIQRIGILARYML